MNGDEKNETFEKRNEADSNMIRESEKSYAGYMLNFQ